MFNLFKKTISETQYLITGIQYINNWAIKNDKIIKQDFCELFGYSNNFSIEDFLSNSDELFYATLAYSMRAFSNLFSPQQAERLNLRTKEILEFMNFDINILNTYLEAHKDEYFIDDGISNEMFGLIEKLARRWNIKDEASEENNKRDSVFVLLFILEKIISPCGIWKYLKDKYKISPKNDSISQYITKL